MEVFSLPTFPLFLTFISNSLKLIVGVQSNNISSSDNGFRAVPFLRSIWSKLFLIVSSYHKSITSILILFLANHAIWSWIFCFKLLFIQTYEEETGPSINPLFPQLTSQLEPPHCVLLFPTMLLYCSLGIVSWTCRTMCQGTLWSWNRYQN